MAEHTPVCDNDEGMRRLANHAGRKGKAVAPAAAPTTPTPRPATAVEPATRGAGGGVDDDADSSASNSDSDGDDDADFCEAGALIDPAVTKPGDNVAVCFNGRGGAPAHYRGSVVRVMRNSARIRFREFEDQFLNYDITFDRIREVT